MIMDFSSIVGALTNGLSGGVLGVVSGIFGSGVTAFINHRKKKQDHAHEKEMRLMDQADMKLENELNMSRDKAAADAEKSVAELGAFKESLKGANKQLFKKEYMQDLPAWAKTIVALLLAAVDVIKQTIRPALTYYFLWKGAEILNKVLESGTVLSKVTPDNVVSIFLYLMVTTVTWWLGQRPMDKVIDKIMPA
jgi:hypothetical protein